MGSDATYATRLIGQLKWLWERWLWPEHPFLMFQNVRVFLYLCTLVIDSQANDYHAFALGEVSGRGIVSMTCAHRPFLVGGLVDLPMMRVMQPVVCGELEGSILLDPIPKLH